MIWGWLQIDEVLTIGNEVSADIKSKYPWAMCHPHFSHPQRGEKNTVYIAREKLSLNGDTDLPGAGVFTHFSEDLQLTDPEQKRRSVWKLPKWFYPDNGKKPLTYHDNMDRWEKKNGCAQLQSAHIGQEFVLDCASYPEAMGWVRDKIEKNKWQQ